MFKAMIEGFRAWRRGDKRIAPAGLRGRVYGRGDNSRGGSHAAAGKATAQMTMKITRANGEVEYRTVPAQIRSIKDG